MLLFQPKQKRAGAGYFYLFGLVLVEKNWREFLNGVFGSNVQGQISIFPTQKPMIPGQCDHRSIIRAKLRTGEKNLDAFGGSRLCHSVSQSVIACDTTSNDNG